MALAMRAPLAALVFSLAFLSQARAQNEDLIPIPEQWEGFSGVTSEPSFPMTVGPVAEMARAPAGAPLTAGSSIPTENMAPPKPYVEPRPVATTELVTEGEADCCEYFQDCCGPLWTVYGDGVFLHRSGPTNAVLFNNGAGNPVLNAADPHTAAMAEYCPGSVVFFALDENHPVLAAHRAAGKRAVFVRNNAIILADGPQEEVLLCLDRAPLTHGGKITFQVENTIATVAAVWSLGIPLDIIRTRVESFAANMEMAPGRFNLLDINGATVIIDYGHNASFAAVAQRRDGPLPAPTRTVVYSKGVAPTRDGDLIRVGELLGNAFDRVILYEDHSVRGRADGEIMRLMREGLAKGARTNEIQDIRGAVNAVEAGLKCAQPGEFVLIQADTIDETVQFLRRYLTTLAPRAPKEPSLSSVAVK